MPIRIRDKFDGVEVAIEAETAAEAIDAYKSLATAIPAIIDEAHGV